MTIKNNYWLALNEKRLTDEQLTGAASHWNGDGFSYIEYKESELITRSLTQSSQSWEEINKTITSFPVGTEVTHHFHHRAMELRKDTKWRKVAPNAWVTWP